MPHLTACWPHLTAVSCTLQRVRRTALRVGRTAFATQENIFLLVLYLQVFALTIKFCTCNLMKRLIYVQTKTKSINFFMTVNLCSVLNSVFSIRKSTVIKLVCSGLSQVNWVPLVSPVINTCVCTQNGRFH